jgi:hypothetical protein
VKSRVRVGILYFRRNEVFLSSLKIWIWRWWSSPSSWDRGPWSWISSYLLLFLSLLLLILFPSLASSCFLHLKRGDGMGVSGWCGVSGFWWPSHSIHAARWGQGWERRAAHLNEFCWLGVPRNSPSGDRLV